MKSLQRRLHHLERGVRLVPSTEALREIPDAEFFALVGLPLTPTPDQIAVLRAEVEQDLTKTAPGLLTKKC